MATKCKSFTTKKKAPMSEELYQKVCQPAFRRIEEAVEKCASKEDVKSIGDKVDDLVRRIDIGNGKPSIREDIQGLKDNVDGIISMRNWTLGIVSAVVILLSSIAVYDWLDARTHIASAKAGIVTSGKP